MRTVGTVVRGIRTPIIKEKDNLSEIAKRKYNIFKTISIFFYVLTGIWVVAFIYLYIIDINNPLFDFIISPAFSKMSSLNSFDNSL